MAEETVVVAFALCRGGCGMQLDRKAIEWPVGYICYPCLVKERNELLAMLRKMEWASVACPCCRRYQIAGHTRQCEVGNLLERLNVDEGTDRVGEGRR